LDAQAALFHFPQNPTVLVHRDTSYSCQNLAMLGTDLLCGDPLFVHPAWGEQGDYHVGPGSPARDAGVATPVTHDLEGHPRDARPDLGAYEAP